MGILMGGAIRDAVSHAGLPFASACVTGTFHCYSTDGNGLWNNLSDGGAYAYGGVSVTFSAGGHNPKTLNLTGVAYYPDLGINGLWEVVELDRAPAPPPDTTCFSANTLVTMADGSQRPIAAVTVGDVVVGHQGLLCRVTAIDCHELGAEALFGFDGVPAFFTDNHPLLGVRGWCALDPERAFLSHPDVPLAGMRPGDRLVTAREVRILELAGAGSAEVEVTLAERSVARIVEDRTNANRTVYNLRLDRGHTYLVNGFVAHNKNH